MTLKKSRCACRSLTSWDLPYLSGEESAQHHAKVPTPPTHQLHPYLNAASPLEIRDYFQQIPPPLTSSAPKRLQLLREGCRLLLPHEAEHSSKRSSTGYVSRTLDSIPPNSTSRQSVFPNLQATIRVESFCPPGEAMLRRRRYRRQPLQSDA